jgi:nucleotide-binding universal stress UspA family protein
MFERIVVGVDGSPEGHDAVTLGAAIAEATGAQCSLVHVFSPSLFPIAGMTDRRTLRTHAERALRAERQRLIPSATVHVVSDTSVPRGLRHYAERLGADLVVIGSGRGTTPGHVHIGRRSRQLLWEAPFAVAIARRGLADDGCTLGSILVGYDGEPEAEPAFDAAAELADAAHGRLRVLTVLEQPAHSHGPFAVPGHHDGVDAEERRLDALTNAQARAHSLSVPAEVEVAVGDPGHSLRDRSHDTDLIVIGSRRWGSVARIVSGSVGETLVGGAHCSVVIVPRPSRGARRRAALSRSAADS